MNTLLTSRDSAALWDELAGKLYDSYHQGRELVLLVPEQTTLQAERDALKALKTRGFFRLQVLSPSRLATLVFDRLGRDPRALIDERGQALTLARVLEDIKGALPVYGRARKLPGFTRKLMGAIRELKSAGLKPEALMEYAQALPLPDPRLLDLAALYAAYEQALLGQLADREDKDREMLSRLREGRLFHGQDILVYGFDLLSPPLTRLLTTLAGQADSLLVTLVCDRPAAPDGDAFRAVYQSALAFTQALQEEGLPWEWQVENSPPRPRSAALSHLEGQLLRVKQQVFEGEAQGLSLFAAKTPYEEARRAAQTIHELLASGEDPEKIAIYYTRDEYAGLLRGVLADYGIPHYVASKSPLLGQPLVRCLLDALRCVQAAVWRPQDVFSFIKSPFSPLKPQEAWELENYARAYGIRGRAWTKPFTRGNQEVRERAEALRLLAIPPIDRLRENLVKARDTQASLDAALHFLEELGVEDRLVLMDRRYLRLGLMEEAQRASQVWEQLMGLFEQMRQLLGGERIPLMRFALLLEAGLSMTELSTLPPLSQCVMAGELGQLMVSGTRRAFILGLNSDALAAGGEALMDDHERSDLEKAMGLRLNLGVPELESVRLLDFWKALAQANEGVFLSYALSDDQGKALTPLLLLSRLHRMFPRLQEEGGALYTLRDSRPYTPLSALNELAVLLREGPLPPVWKQALDYLLQDEEYGRRARALLKVVQGDAPEKRLGKKQTGLMARAGAVSVSRLETFAGCPFQHFVRYGLKPKKREEWALEPTELGSFCHAAMDSFTKRMRHRPDWGELSREEATAEMDAVLSDLTQGWEDAAWADTPRARQKANKTLNLCRKMAWSLTEGRSASDFRTVASELNFGLKEGLPPILIPLRDGSSLKLTGTIDRVDLAVLDSGLKVLRVVDYKSGQVTLQGGEIEKGAQLQLLLYLQAALDLLGAQLPGGALYQRMHDPLVKAETPEEAQKETRKELRLDGVLLSNGEVIKMMDRGSPPLTLVSLLDKDGEPKENNRLLTEEELCALMALAREKTKALAKDIFTGLITRSPLIHQSGRAQCEFCEYQGLCRTEKPSREKRRRHSRKITPKALAQSALADDKQAPPVL